MSTLSIGEVARRSDLRASAIRYYEKLGLLAKPPRVSGRRQYDGQVLERLAIVRFAKHVGFSIAEITQLLDGTRKRPPPERWRKMANDKITDLDAFIAQAETVRRMLQKSLHNRCPRLVERGRALDISDPGCRRVNTRRTKAAPKQSGQLQHGACGMRPSRER